MPEQLPFEQLVVWQEARSFAVEIYRLTATEPLCRDFAMRNQLRRSAISVAANIAEGWERSRRNELLHFLTIAKGSCAEVRSHLHVCRDLGYMRRDHHARLVGTARRIGGRLGALWLTTKRRTLPPLALSP